MSAFLCHVRQASVAIGAAQLSQMLLLEENLHSRLQKVRVPSKSPLGDIGPCKGHILTTIWRPLPTTSNAAPKWGLRVAKAFC